MTSVSRLPRRIVAALIAVVLVATAFILAGPASAVPFNPAVLVYADGQRNVFTAALDGSGAKRVLTNALSPVVSPSGTEIAYVDGPSGKLAVADINGNGRRLLGIVANPSSWTTDGATLAVETGLGIGTVNVATGALHQIPNSAGEINPQISPDNTFILSSASSAARGIIRRLDGSTPRLRTSSPAGVFSRNGATVLSNNTDDGHVSYRVRDSLSGAVRWSGALPNSKPSDPGDYLTGAAFSPDSTTAFIGVRYYKLARISTEYPVGIYTVTQAHPNPTTPLIANAWYPSVGGGPRPSDTNGAPPAVTNATGHTSDNAATLSWTLPAVADAAGVDVRYSVGLTYPTGPTAGSDWGRLLDSTLSLPNLPPDTTYSVSIFSRDWFGNVGPAAHVRLVVPHQSLTTIHSSASPADLVYPARTTISGDLVRTPDGQPITGATLNIYRQVLGTTTAFTKLGTTTTDGNGRWSFIQAPAASYIYRVTFFRTPEQALATVDTRVRVARGLTISVSATRAPANSQVFVVTRSAPPLVKGLTYLQGARSNVAPGGGSFVRLGPHATDANGVVIYTVRVPPRGITWRYRVEVPGQLPYISSLSAPVSITGT
jgi:hypothetical protein